MLESVAGETRIAIVEARRLALTGRERDAFLCLEGKLADSSLCLIDRAAILLTKAELLYLAGGYKASHEVFVKELDLLIPDPDFPHSVALVIGFNRCDVAMSLLDSNEISRFYDLLDEQRIAKIEHWDHSAMLGAARNAAKGHSYESLPAIWRELLRTYRQGRWVAFRQASRNMAEECIRIGKPEEAAFHAAIACDAEFAKQIAVALLNSQNKDMVVATVNKLLATANLQRHFAVACELLQTLSDAVPDSLVDGVIDWALLRCANSEEPEDHAATEMTAWKTVKSLAKRASENTAEKIVTVALGHRAWTAKAEKPNQIILVRKDVIEAVDQSVAAMPLESFDKLADAVIPLATERHNSFDFDNIVDLLSHIAYRGSDKVKTKIRSALYPPGQSVTPLLVQMAPNFGKEITNKDNQLEKMAITIAKNIQRVVQRVAKDDEPEPVYGSIMTFNSTKEDQKLIVHLISTVDVHAVARNRKLFPSESLRVVITALLEAIHNQDNLLVNRLAFIDCLRQFADCLDEDLTGEIFNILSPIAIGNINISTDIASSMNQSSPLSRVTINTTTPEQVTAHALFVLACIERCHPGLYGQRLQRIVEEALSSDTPKIRECAFAAVREIPTFVESTWVPLLLGMRDPDPQAASLAFDAIAAKENFRLTRAQWRMVIYSLKIAQRSPSIEVRKAAATAAVSLEPQTQIKTIQQELTAIRDLFSNDIAHSVRLAANKKVRLVETT